MLCSFLHAFVNVAWLSLISDLRYRRVCARGHVGFYSKSRNTIPQIQNPAAVVVVADAGAENRRSVMHALQLVYPNATVLVCVWNAEKFLLANRCSVQQAAPTRAAWLPPPPHRPLSAGAAPLTSNCSPNPSTPYPPPPASLPCRSACQQHTDFGEKQETLLFAVDITNPHMISTTSKDKRDWE